MPMWAEKDAVKLIAEAWDAWDESRKTAVVLENETVAEVKDVYVVYCYGKIKSVYGNAQIKYVYNFATAIKDGILYVAKDCKVNRKGTISKPKKVKVEK